MSCTARIMSSINVCFQEFPEPDTISLGVYFVGCDFNCYKCHNPELQKVNGIGVDYTPMDLHREIQSRSRGMDLTLTLVGGDPFSVQSREFTKEFLQINTKRVIIYTGYELEQLYHIPEVKEILNLHCFDYLKTGQYEFKKRQRSELTETHFKLASKNQKLYNQSLELLTVEGIYNFKKNGEENAQQ